MENKNKQKSETLQIYVELGGESSKERQRSNKLIEEIYKTKNKIEKQPNFNNIKIILSGKGSFKYNVKKTEAQDMKQYIQSQKPIPSKCFILEKEAMDTLGNVYFSAKIILKIIKNIKLTQYNKIQINIITQEFHMHRTKDFFQKIFHNEHFKTSVEYNFIKAKTHFHSLIKQFIRTDIDYLIQKAVDFDFIKFKIKTFQDYENYIFSLPIYAEHYKAKHEINGNSAYETLIETHSNKIKKNNNK